jgi:hypothetical protein
MMDSTTCTPMSTSTNRYDSSLSETTASSDESSPGRPTQLSACRTSQGLATSRSRAAKANSTSLKSGL